MGTFADTDNANVYKDSEWHTYRPKGTGFERQNNMYDLSTFVQGERGEERERKIIAIFQQTKWPKRSLYCVANECILQPSIPLFDHLSVFQQT